MAQEQFLSDELEFEAQKRTFKRRCGIIKKWMQNEEAEMNKNTVDIPDFMKPQEDTFEYRFHSGIRTAINCGKFWELYDMALNTINA